MFVCIGVIVIAVGATGIAKTVFDNLKPFVALLPQPDHALTLILSPAIEAAFDAYINLITLSLVTSLESTVTPDTPPTDVGNVHA